MGLSEGDIVVFDGIFAVNRVTKQRTDRLQEFVVTDDTGEHFYPTPPASAKNPRVVRRVPVYR